MSWKLVCLWPRRPPGLEPRSELGRVPQSRGSWRVLPTRRKTARVLKEMSCFGNNLRRNRPSESGLGSFARPHSQRQVLKINGKLAGLRQRRGQPPLPRGCQSTRRQGGGRCCDPIKSLEKQGAPHTGAVRTLALTAVCFTREPLAQRSPLHETRRTQPGGPRPLPRRAGPRHYFHRNENGSL